jgi:hypothetical protein
MASPAKKGVLLDVNIKKNVSSPPKLHQKLQRRQPSPQKTAQQLFEKLEGAAARRDVELEEKKFKAQAMATPKGAKPPSPTKAQIDVKMAQAARNRSQQEVEKVERAAQETMKLAQARERRALMDTHAREVAAISLNTKEVDCERRLMELDLEKEKKRMVDNTKREKVYERLAEDRERRAALLDEKLERATELKGQHDDLTRLRAAATSTCRVAAAQTRRDVDDAERRLHAAAELSTKMEESSRRREIETLDKVVRAASLGSAAVATAARRRAGLDNREKAIGARQLEIKLTGAELERRRKLEDVRNKAASLGTARVEAAAQERKYRQAMELMEGEHTRNANKLAADRALNATMLKSGKASMANAAKMQVREEKATGEMKAVNDAKARLDAKLNEAEQRVQEGGVHLRTKYRGIKKVVTTPPADNSPFLVEHGYFIGGCVAGGLAAVFALSRVLARFS